MNFDFAYVVRIPTTFSFFYHVARNLSRASWIDFSHNFCPYLCAMSFLVGLYLDFSPTQLVLRGLGSHWIYLHFRYDTLFSPHIFTRFVGGLVVSGTMYHFDLIRSRVSFLISLIQFLVFWINFKLSKNVCRMW